MSLKDIRIASLNRLAVLLPDYAQLTNQMNVDDNSDRELEKGYASVWNEGIPADGPLRKVALNSTLDVSITNGLDVRADDDVAPSIDDMYESIETIIASFHNGTFLDVPNKLRGIRGVRIAPPRLFNEKRFVEIKISFTMDYTIPIDC